MTLAKAARQPSIRPLSQAAASRGSEVTEAVKSTDRVRDLDALTDQDRPGPMQHHDALLLGRLHRYEPHGRPSDRLADRLRVGHVVLLALHVGLHIARRHQAHIVTELDQFARPVMRGSAGLDPHQTRSELAEELQQARSRQLLSNDNAAFSIDAVHLEHRLRDVQSDSDHLSHGSPPALTGSQRCRWVGEPSTASRADTNCPPTRRHSNRGSGLSNACDLSECQTRESALLRTTTFSAAMHYPTVT